MLLGTPCSNFHVSRDSLFKFPCFLGLPVQIPMFLITPCSNSHVSYNSLSIFPSFLGLSVYIPMFLGTHCLCSIFLRTPCLYFNVSWDSLYMYTHVFRDSLFTFPCFLGLPVQEIFPYFQGLLVLGRIYSL